MRREELSQCLRGRAIFDNGASLIVDHTIIVVDHLDECVRRFQFVIIVVVDVVVVT